MEPSRDHPTPYPGKTRQRRSIRQSIKEQENKTLAETNDLVTATPKRQKHILSISKSVNTLDLPAKDKPIKPSRRLSVSSKNAVPVTKTVSKDIRFAVSENKSTASKSSPLSGASFPKAGRTLEVESKVKPSTKALSVSFQGPLPKSQAKVTASSKDVLLTTPGSNKSAISITPLEDFNQGQRKFNTLMTSTYWLSQIKLSECAGKHAVSLGFFRLALESNAEPFQKLCDELKLYAKKHHVLEYGEVAKDVLLSYGVLEEVMSADIDGHLVEIEVPGEGSFSESKGLLTPSHEKCSIILDSSFEESEVCLSKIDEEVIGGGDNIQEAVQSKSNALLPVASGSKIEVLSNKVYSAEGEGNSYDACDADIQTSISSQKICTGKGNFIEVDARESVPSPTDTGSKSAKKNATRKGTTLIPVPGIKSQTSVRKSLKTDSAQKTGAINKLHCAPRRSQTMNTTSNESQSRKDSRQVPKKTTAMNDLLRSDQPSSSDNAKEEDDDKLGSQNRHQLSKCKDSKDLPKELVENLETMPSIATLPGGHFDIQNMSVDTLMDEVVSCIVSSMDDCTDSADLGSVKSSEYQNIDANCITEGIAEVLHSSDISTASRNFTDAHVNTNTTGFSIIQKTNMASRNGDQEIRDILDDIPYLKEGYAEEIDANVSFIKEKGEKEDDCTREVLHSSDISTASRNFTDAHVNTTGFSIIQKINMASRNGDQEMRDILDDIPYLKEGYAEEIDASVSFIKEKGEKEDDCTLATAQQDTTKHDMLEDNQIRVVKSNPELNETSCGSHGSKLEKDMPGEILTILKKDTLNGSCQVPLTEGESMDTPVKEKKSQKNKSNEGSKSDSQNSCATPGTVRRSSRLRDRQNT